MFVFFPVKLFCLRDIFYLIVTGTNRVQGHLFGIFGTGTFSVPWAIFRTFIPNLFHGHMSPSLLRELSWAIYVYSRAVFSEVSLGGKIFTERKSLLLKPLPQNVQD